METYVKANLLYSGNTAKLIKREKAIYHKGQLYYIYPKANYPGIEIEFYIHAHSTVIKQIFMFEKAWILCIFIWIYTRDRITYVHLVLWTKEYLD